MYLLDTNVVSELRRRKPDPTVRAWLGSQADDHLFLSVIVIGEIRQGVERLRRRDWSQAEALDSWLQATVDAFGYRILPVTVEIAQEWGRGRLNSGDPLPAADALIAATAKVHGLIVATRNTTDYAPTGISVLNPFVALSTEP
jgi:predicted nucleic acid-binding protein